jgi:hypothetical protein
MRYRLTLAQRFAPFAIAGCVVIVCMEAMFRLADGRFYWSEAWQALAATAVASAASVFISRDFGIETRGDEAVVHGAGRRTIRRADVASIGIETVAGVRSVVLREFSGKRTRLRAPNSMFDPDFDNKVRDIERWWHGESTRHH